MRLAVSTDSGQGWHPFLRINLAAKVCVHGSDRWEWINHWLPACGEQWAARVACFADKQTRLEDCTLLVCREPGYAEPWVIDTDLLPADAWGVVSLTRLDRRWL